MDQVHVLGKNECYLERVVEHMMNARTGRIASMKQGGKDMSHSRLPGNARGASDVISHTKQYAGAQQWCRVPGNVRRPVMWCHTLDKGREGMLLS